MVNYNREYVLKAGGENLNPTSGVMQDYPEVQVLALGGDSEYIVRFVNLNDSTLEGEIEDGALVGVRVDGGYLRTVLEANGAYIAQVTGYNDESDPFRKSYEFSSTNDGFTLSTTNGAALGTDGTYLRYVHEGENIEEVTFTVTEPGSNGGGTNIWLIVGIIVGVIVLIIVIGLIVFFVTRKKKPKLAVEETVVDPARATQSTTSEITTLSQ